MTVLNTLCPACRKKAFGFLVKLMLGPAGAVPCPSCGASIGVSIWPHLAGVLAFIAYVIVSALPSSPLPDGPFAGVLFVSIVLVWGLWFLQAPLARKKED